MSSRLWATNFRRFRVGDLLDPQDEGGWSAPSLSMLRKYSHAKTPEEHGRVTPLAAMLTRRSAELTIRQQVRINRSRRESTVHGTHDDTPDREE